MHFSCWLVFLRWMSTLSSWLVSRRKSDKVSCFGNIFMSERSTWPRHRPSPLHCFTVSAGVLGEYPASGELASVTRNLTRLSNENMADLSCLLSIIVPKILICWLYSYLELRCVSFIDDIQKIIMLLTDHKTIITTSLINILVVPNAETTTQQI